MSFNRLCVSGKGERVLGSIEDSVNESIQPLEDCIKKHGGGLITATKSNTDNTRIYQTKITRKQKWQEKQTVWINKQHLTRENLDMAKKAKP